MKKFAIVYIFISIFLIVYLIYLNYSKKPKIVEKTITQYIEVEKPHYITKVKKIEIPVEKIVTLEKEKVVEKESLPVWLKGATEQVILAVGDIEPYVGKTRVISLLNTKTGEGSLIQKQLPLPLVEFKSNLRFSGGYNLFNQRPYGNFEFTFFRFSKVNFKVEGGFLERFYGGVGVWIEF